ncbi:hypothetical protein CR513_19096, partial [Mucuna pruriens]
MEEFGDEIHRGYAFGFYPPRALMFPKDAFVLMVAKEESKYIKRCDLAFDQVSKERKLQLQEFEELRLEAYENSNIYKERIYVAMRVEVTTRVD